MSDITQAIIADDNTLIIGGGRQRTITLPPRDGAPCWVRLSGDAFVVSLLVTPGGSRSFELDGESWVVEAPTLTAGEVSDG